MYYIIYTNKIKKKKKKKNTRNKTMKFYCSNYKKFFSFNFHVY